MTSVPATRLMVLVFTDIADSTALNSKIGTTEYSQFSAWHDEVFRGIVDQIPGAELLKDVGDGFMARFDTASHAVEAALVFQSALSTYETSQVIRVRIGVHQGEVTELGKDIHGKVKLVGLAADLASRVMSLALPGQILLTQGVFDDARLYIREYPGRLDTFGAGPAEGDGERELRWIAHGNYSFKGSTDSMRVYEVGVDGIAPLAAPPNSEKAWRTISDEEREVLGWRPGMDLLIPGRPSWVLREAMYADAHHENWVAEHSATTERRTFKFCFDAERVRAFRRETVLLRAMREELGERLDIAKIFEVQLERSPFFIEIEYTPLGTLLEWGAAEGGSGGLLSLPLPERVNIVARVAEAAAAAHSAQVLHKNLRPASILIFRDADGTIRPKLADFGAGVLTASGDGAVAEESVSDTKMYAAPEVLAGSGHTSQNDVYALGVLLFQMVVGDLARPLGQGWRREVEDDLLRKIVSLCVRSDPSEGSLSARELCHRLATLDEARDRTRRDQRQGALARKRKRTLRSAISVVVPALIAVATWWVMNARVKDMEMRIAEAERNVGSAQAEASTARADADASRDSARREGYFGNLLAADISLRDNDIRDAKQTLAACGPSLRGWEWEHLSFKADSSQLCMEGHGGSVTALAYSPEGTLIVSAAKDKSILVWDAASGEPIVELNEEGRENQQAPSSLGFGEGGSVLSFGGLNDEILRSWSVAGVAEASTRLEENAVGASAFSPDGNRFAFCAADNSVRVADRRTGLIEQEFEPQDTVRALTFTSSGTMVLACMDSGVLVFDVATGSARHLDIEGGAVYSVATYPNSESFVVGFEDGSIRRFDPTSATSDWRAIEHDGVVFALAVSPDGSLIASGSLDKSVCIWDGATGELLSQYRGHDGSVRHVTFSPDGDRVVSGSDDHTLRVWLGRGFGPVRKWDGPDSTGYPTSVALDATGGLILIGGDLGALEIRDAASGALLMSKEGPEDEVTNVGFSPDGKLFAAGFFEESSVHLWEFVEDSGAERGAGVALPLAVREVALLQHDTSIQALAFHPGGSFLATVSDCVRFWDLRGEEMPAFVMEEGSSRVLAFSADGRHLAVGAMDGKIHLFVVKNRIKLRTFEGHQGAISALAFAADSGLLASGSTDQIVRVWDTTSGDSVAVLRGHDAEISGVAIDPKGQRVFSSSLDSTLRIWDVTAARHILTLRDPKGPVYGFALAQNGKRLVAVSDDNTIRAWETGARRVAGGSVPAGGGEAK